MSERNAPLQSSQAQRDAPAPRPRRRRRLRVAIVLVVVLVALIALAPQILSLGPVKDILFARASARVGMRISADQLSLSWFGNQTIRGLYVADSSLFPTALGVNPMVTVMLLARRVARTVIAEASAG